MRFLIEYIIFSSSKDTAMKKNKHAILVAFWPCSMPNLLFWYDD